MTREEQIQEILDVIERKEYEISYEAPQCITLKSDEQSWFWQSQVHPEFVFLKKWFKD